jgi:hypothetical protein
MFEKKVMNLINNKYVLYLSLFVSLVYVYLLIAKQHFNSVVFFVILGVLSSYFSKNMVIVLLVPLVLTHVLSSANVIKEGMKGGKKNKKQEGVENKEEEEEKEGAQPKDKSKVTAEYMMNNAKNTDAAMSNLNEAMSEKEAASALNAIEKMSQHQETMMNNLEKMQPMVEKAQSMMKSMGGLDKMDNMIGGLSNMMGKMNGGK